MEAVKVSGFAFQATLATALAIFCLAALPLEITMIVIGAKYKDECPVENMIPIYLIVLGAASLFTTCCAGGIRYNQGWDQGEEQSTNPLQVLMESFLFAWFICGNVWIYKNHEPNYADSESADYCNKTLYLFAFWVTNTYYIIIGIGMLFYCLVYIFVVVFGRRPRDIEIEITYV